MKKEKVVVSAELYKVLNEVKEIYTDEEILLLHARRLNSLETIWRSNYKEEFDKLTLMELANILISGYEGKKTIRARIEDFVDSFKPVENTGQLYLAEYAGAILCADTIIKILEEEGINID